MLEFQPKTALDLVSDFFYQGNKKIYFSKTLLKNNKGKIERNITILSSNFPNALLTNKEAQNDIYSMAISNNALETNKRKMLDVESISCQKILNKNDLNLDAIEKLNYGVTFSYHNQDGELGNKNVIVLSDAPISDTMIKACVKCNLEHMKKPVDDPDKDTIGPDSLYNVNYGILNGGGYAEESCFVASSSPRSSIGLISKIISNATKTASFDSSKDSEIEKD